LQLRTRRDCTEEKEVGNSLLPFCFPTVEKYGGINSGQIKGDGIPTEGLPAQIAVSKYADGSSWTAR
jgi:hypothetical protein